MWLNSHQQTRENSASLLLEQLHGVFPQNITTSIYWYEEG
jgi:hypothetical protein